MTPRPRNPAPRVPKPRKNVYRSAYDKGAAARAEGKTKDACPYDDKRTWRGAVTFSRAFRKAWLAGFKGERF